MLHGISSACAKFLREEALALFVEAWRKGEISQEIGIKAGALELKLQCMSLKRIYQVSVSIQNMF